MSIFTKQGYAVTSATSVQEALKCINAESIDVLLRDLHMPVAGDGLTVVSAMRHVNPQAGTLLLSAFPQTEAATKAILLQANADSRQTHGYKRPYGCDHAETGKGTAFRSSSDRECRYDSRMQNEGYNSALARACSLEQECDESRAERRNTQ